MVNQPGPAYNQGTADDIFFRNARSTLNYRPPIPNRLRDISFRLPREWQGTVQAWELTIYDLAAGIQRFFGPFGTLSNGYAFSDGMDLTHSGYILLSQLVTSATSPDPTGNLNGMHSAFIFNTLIMGAGSGTNVSLIKETSATDPTPAAITYNPLNTSGVISLSTFVLGGVTAQRYLAVGLSADITELISDASGTLVGTAMHADTAGMYWAIQTSLPDPAGSGGFVIIMQSGNNIRKLLTSDAIGTQPTITTPNVPAGSWLIGEHSLASGPMGVLNRIWIGLPPQDTTNHALRFGAEVKVQVNSLSLEGKDIQPLLFNEMPAGVIQAAYINSPVYGGSIVATDGERVVLHNGDEEKNLEIFSEATVPMILGAVTFGGNALEVPRCRGFVVNGADLYAIVQAVTNSGGSFASYFSWWKYDWLNGSWHTVTTWTALDVTTDLRGVLAPGSHAVSPNTGYTHFYANGSWHRTKLFKPGEIPYPGGNNAVGLTNNFAAAGTLYSPRWEISEGLPSVIESVGVHGDINNSGSSGSIAFTFGRQTDYNTLTLGGGHIADKATFNDSNKFEESFRFRNYRRFPSNTDFFYELYFSLVMTRGATATRSPMVNRIHIRGLTFMDGVVRSPKEVWGDKW